MATIEPQETQYMSTVDPFGYGIFRAKNSAYDKTFSSGSFRAPPDNWFAMQKEYSVTVTLSNTGVVFDKGEWTE